MAAHALADELVISTMAVRQHLYGLAEQGLVSSSTSPDGIGRPAKIWQLSASADEFFPHGYGELTVSLLDNMRQAFGSKGVDKIVELRTSQQIKLYKAQIPADTKLADKLDKLAEIRTSEGYMAEVQQQDGGFLFIENHCPICAAARACAGLCAGELALFRTVLGKDVHVERDEHILLGARRCAYRVTSVSR